MGKANFLGGTLPSNGDTKEGSVRRGIKRRSYQVSTDNTHPNGFILMDVTFTLKGKAIASMKWNVVQTDIDFQTIELRNEGNSFGSSVNLVNNVGSVSFYLYNGSWNQQTYIVSNTDLGASESYGTATIYADDFVINIYSSVCKDVTK